MGVKIGTKGLYHVLENTPSEQNIMLTGKHGIGKSRILEQYFTQQGQRVVILFLGQMSDPGDLIGLPYKDGNHRQDGLYAPVLVATRRKACRTFFGRAEPRSPRSATDCDGFNLEQKTCRKISSTGKPHYKRGERW